MSAHADAGEIMRWLSGFSQAAGDDLPRPRRAGGARRRWPPGSTPSVGWPVHIAQYLERVELDLDRLRQRRSTECESVARASVGRIALLKTASAIVRCGQRTPSDGVLVRRRRRRPHRPPPADRQVSARARRRCGGRAAVRGRFRELPLKEKTLVWHLYQAAIAGRDIYLRPALRAQPRDARRARGDRHAPERRRSRRRSPRSSATRSCSGSTPARTTT